MKAAVGNFQYIYGYALLLLGFAFLVVNHISILAGSAWLIPEFLRLQ